MKTKLFKLLRYGFTKLSMLLLFSPWWDAQIKRGFYIASAYAYLVEEGVLQQITLSDLNRNMKIGLSESAVQVPVFLGGGLWSSTKVLALTGNPVCNTRTGCRIDYEHAELMSAAMIANAPDYLRYEERGMFTDIVALLMSTPSQPLAA